VQIDVEKEILPLQLSHISERSLTLMHDNQNNNSVILLEPMDIKSYIISLATTKFTRNPPPLEWGTESRPVPRQISFELDNKETQNDVRLENAEKFRVEQEPRGYVNLIWVYLLGVLSVVLLFKFAPRRKFLLYFVLIFVVESGLQLYIFFG